MGSHFLSAERYSCSCLVRSPVVCCAGSLAESFSFCSFCSLVGPGSSAAADRPMEARASRVAVQMEVSALMSFSLSRGVALFFKRMEHAAAHVRQIRILRDTA